MAPKNYAPITVRPAQALRPALERLATDLGKSEGQVIGDLVADCLEMLEKEINFVPKSIRAARALRASGATFAAKAEPITLLRDRREVSFYEDCQAEAGMTSGTFSDNPPGTITVPDDWTAPVDFVVKVHGDSMKGLVHDGDLAAFKSANKAMDGQIVTALVDGQIMIKMFKEAYGLPASLLSLNPKYPPIPCTADVIIQGIYTGTFPTPPRRKARH